MMLCCRMLGRRDEETSEPMIDVKYSQSEEERSVVAVLQKLYLCASVEFLMAVGDFFVQALPTSPPAQNQRDKTSQLPLKHVSEPKIQSEPKAGVNSTAETNIKFFFVQLLFFIDTELFTVNF